MIPMLAIIMYHDNQFIYFFFYNLGVNKSKLLALITNYFHARYNDVL